MKFNEIKDEWLFLQKIALQRAFFPPIYGKGHHAELPAQKFFKGGAARSPLV